MVAVYTIKQEASCQEAEIVLPDQRYFTLSEAETDMSHQ